MAIRKVLSTGPHNDSALYISIYTIISTKFDNRAGYVIYNYNNDFYYYGNDEYGEYRPVEANLLSSLEASSRFTK